MNINNLTENSLITYPRINIIDDGKLWSCDAMITTGKNCIYVPPIERNMKAVTGGYQDEFFYLPITESEFKKHRTLYIGYRFIFRGGKSISIKMVGMKPGDDIRQSELIYTISKIYFKTKGSHNIIIDTYKDPLFPPTVVTLDGSTKDIDGVLVSCIMDIIDLHADYYRDHRV